MCPSARRDNHKLRDLTSHCEYGASAKELICDRLVCGIRDDALQRSLLAVAELTFWRAFERALLHESAVQNARMLNTPADVHRTPLEPRSTPTESLQQTECYTAVEGVTPPRTVGSVTAYAIIATRRVISNWSVGAASSSGRAAASNVVRTSWMVSLPPHPHQPHQHLCRLMHWTWTTTCLL